MKSQNGSPAKGDPWGAYAVDGKKGYGFGGSIHGSDQVLVQFFVNDGVSRNSSDIPAQPRDQWIDYAFVVDRGSGQMRGDAGG